jgi:glycosyltransferase involved in cell wall biosynthesis
MRVLITAEMLRNRVVTGVEQYTRQLISALARIPGIDLTILCEDPQHAKTFGDLVQCLIYRPPARAREVCHVVWPPRGLKQFDVIHCPTVLAPFCCRPGPRVVMTCHDLSPLIEPGWHRLRDRLYFRHLLPLRLGMVDHFLASSQSTKRDMERHYHIPQGRITTVYLGCSAEFFPANGVKENYLLTVGTLEPRKNLKRVIEAFIYLKQHRQDVADRLLVVGTRGWYYGEAFELMQRYADSVQFLGYVSDQDLQHLYRRAKGLIYPSFYEGFGLPVLEAMASGCPVVTSDRSSLPEIGGDAVLYVNPDNVLEIAAAMEKLLMDDTLRRTLVERGLCRAAQFSWARCARETVTVYEKTLST